MYAQSSIRRRPEGTHSVLPQSASRPNHYLVAISVHGDSPKPLPAITSRNPLWLGASGSCSQSEAAAVIQIGSDDEPRIGKTSTADVAILRAGRKYHLKPDTPVRLFQDDVIQIDGTDLEIVDLVAVHPFSLPSRRQLLRVLCTIAAVFMLCSFGASAYAQSADGTSQPQKATAMDKKAAATGCTEGVNLCVNNNRYQCIDHRWKLLEECKKPGTCEWDSTTKGTHSKGTHCNPPKPCTDGESTCFGGSHYGHLQHSEPSEVYQCKNGEWVHSETCTGEKECQINYVGIFKAKKAECVQALAVSGEYIEDGNECQLGESTCDANAIKKCSWYNYWYYDSICPEQTECVVDKTTKTASCVKPNQ